MTKDEHIGRLVVRFNPIYDSDEYSNYIKPTLIHGRELGIFVEFLENSPDHGKVYWQEQMKFEELWLGDIAFVDDFEHDNENRNTQREIAQED